MLRTFTGDKDLYFKMREKGDRFVQTAVDRKVGSKETHPMEIVFASGERGQAYANWKGDRLFQLPITYGTPERDWALSPGYLEAVREWTEDGERRLELLFERPVPTRCLECHLDSVESSRGGFESSVLPFDRGSIRLGISCEKCHGPGKRHVQFHKSNPAVKKGRYIVNTGRLSRSKQIFGVCPLPRRGRGYQSRSLFL